MRTKALWLGLFVSLLVTNAAPDDDFLHPHQNALSIGSETVLSGIELYRNTIETAIVKLGNPSTVTLRPTIAPGFTTRSYEWEGRECWLRIVVVEASGRRTIVSIDVWGTRPDAEMGTTGRGLKLGDAISDARRIYGLHTYFGATLTDKSKSFFSLDGCTPGPILKVDFDRTGRINHMGMPIQHAVCY